MFCCVEKEAGHLCRRAHKKGYAVKTKNGAVTIIGGHCAEEKFEANENFSSQRALFENKRRFLLRLGDLHDRINDMAGSISSIRSAETELTQIAALISRAQDGLPPTVYKSLANAGGDSLIVTAQGVRKRPGEDEDGKPIIERTHTEISIGRVPACVAFCEGYVADSLAQLQTIERAYVKASDLDEDVDPKLVGVLLEAVNRLPSLTRSINAALAQLREFYAADLTPLCFLSSRHEERVRALKFAADVAGKPMGKDAARAWIEKRHSQLAKSLRFDSVKVM